MKNTRKFPALFCTLLLMWACGETPITFDQSNLGALNGRMKIVESSLSIPAAGGSGYAVIESDKAFSATTEETWCTVTAADGRVEFSAETNPSVISRNAIITVGNADATIYVTVTQQGQNTDLVSIPASLDCLYSGMDATYTIVSNVDVEVSSTAAEWAHITVADNVVTITIDETLELDDRTCEMTVRTDNKSQTIKVAQSGRFKLSASETEFPKKGDVREFTLISADPFEITFDNSSWLHSAYDAKTHILTLTCDKFSGTTRTRTNNVKITTSLGNVKNIAVTQQLNYDDYLGKWLMEYRWTDDYGTFDPVDYPDEYEHIDVEFVEKERGKTIFMTGFYLDKTIGFVFDYDDTTGLLYLGPQKLCSYSIESHRGNQWLTLWGWETTADGQPDRSSGVYIPCGCTYDSQYKMLCSFNAANTVLTVSACEKNLFPVYMGEGYRNPEDNRYYYRDMYGNPNFLYDMAYGYRFEIWHVIYTDNDTEQVPHYMYGGNKADNCYVAAIDEMFHTPLTFKRQD